MVAPSVSTIENRVHAAQHLVLADPLTDRRARDRGDDALRARHEIVNGDFSAGARRHGVTIVGGDLHP